LEVERPAWSHAAARKQTVGPFRNPFHKYRIGRNLREILNLVHYADAVVMPMFVARGGSAAGQGGALAA